MGTTSRFAILTAVLLILAGATAFASTGLGGGADESRSLRTPAMESPTNRAIHQLQQRLGESSQDTLSLNELGYAYLQKARESGDPSFYSKAEGMFEQVLGLDPADSSGLLGASALAGARHDFENALTLAQRAVDLDPEDPDAQGALGDALIELGYYDEALEAFQRMLDIRPDLNAYVRVAYARELHGDTDGAIEAIHLALDASRPSGETAAWVHSQLANLHFNRGDLKQAKEQYEASLEAFPGYVHSIAGLARVAATEQDYDEAIELYGEVVARQPILEHVAALGDLYRATGREGDAQRKYALVAAIGELYEANGINTDLEMAVFLADHDLRMDEALTMAEDAYRAQPDSIRAADALSWALYKAGQFEEAAQYSKEALRLGTADPSFLFHAGMIRRAAGDDATARAHLSRLADINPNFSVLHAGEAEGVLAELNSAVRQGR